MEHRIQFDKQSLVDAPDPFEAEVRAAKAFVDAVRRVDHYKPVEALLSLGFSVSVRKHPRPN